MPAPSLSLILLLGAYLSSTSFFSSSSLVSAQIMTRDEIYSQAGFVKNWIAPMPNTPIAAASANNTSGQKTNGERYLVENWSTTFQSISVGGKDIAFVADPFSGSGGSGGASASASSKDNVLQIFYPKGSYAPSAGPVVGGAQFYATPFGDSTPFSKMMISYDVAFPDGFDWVMGGKLPGIYGGRANGCSGGSQSGDKDCLSMRLMWRQGGLGEVYAYVPVKGDSHFCKNDDVKCNDQYGKSIGRGMLYFVPGKWTRIDMVMSLNEPAGSNNGVLQVYMNGNRVIDMSDMPFRATGMVGFQGLMFSSFFGGSTPNYATPVDTSVYFRNLQMSVGEPAVLYEGSAGSRSFRGSGLGEMALMSLATIFLGLIVS